MKRDAMENKDFKELWLTQLIITNFLFNNGRF